MNSRNLAELERTTVPARPERKTRLRASAIVLGLIGALVSVLGSWIPSLWGDEVTSVLSSQRSFPSLFSMLGNVDAVHGTYYVFLHFWVDLFGASAFSVRVPSAIAVGIMVTGVVVLTTRLTDLRTGVYAGVIAIALPRVAYMGEEARGYAISAACVVWVTVLLVQILQKGIHSRRTWLLYGFGVAVCAYVFLFSLLILVAHAAIVLAHRHRQTRKNWLLATGLGLVLAVPVIAYGIGERGQIAFLSNRDAANLRTLIVGQWFGNDQFALVAWILVAAALTMAVSGAASRAVSRRRGLKSGHSEAPQANERTAVSNRATSIPNIVLLAATWSLGSMAILVIANAIHPVYSSRYMSFAAPGVAILMAWCVSRIGYRQRGHNWIGVVVLLALVAASLPSYLADRTPYAKNNSDWAQVSAVVKAHSQPGEGILFDESTRPSRAPRLAMHGYPDSYVGLTDIALKQPWWMTKNWRDSVLPLSDVTARLDGVRTVWMIEYKTPGGRANTFNLDLLAELGYTVSHSWQLHSSEVIKLTR